MIGQGANPNFPSAPPVGGGVNSPYPSNQMPPIIGSGGSNQPYREFFCCHFYLINPLLFLKSVKKNGVSRKFLKFSIFLMGSSSSNGLETS